MPDEEAGNEDDLQLDSNEDDSGDLQSESNDGHDPEHDPGNDEDGDESHSDTDGEADVDNIEAESEKSEGQDLHTDCYHGLH